MAQDKFSTAVNKTPLDFVKAGLLDQPLEKDAPYYTDIFKFKETNVPEFEGSIDLPICKTHK